MRLRFLHAHKPYNVITLKRGSRHKTLFHHWWPAILTLEIFDQHFERETMPLFWRYVTQTGQRP